MKKMIVVIGLMISAPGFTKPESVIFPQLYNFRYSVQVNVWNTSDQYVGCSGFIWMSTQNGFRDSAYYFDYVPGHFNTFKNIYVRRGDDRIVSFSHSIMCN